MPSIEHLVTQREQWIKAICTGVVKTIGAHPALAPTMISSELGDSDLVRALLLVRIAVLDARGHTTGDITDLLADSLVFAAPKPEARHLADLVRKTRSRMEYDGLTRSAFLLGLGLRAWSPESTYRLLVEYWSAQRARSVTRTRVKRELSRCWEVQGLRLMDACLSLPPYPLEGYPDLWARLKAEPDFRVGNFAALGLSGKGANKQAWERWVERLPFTTYKAGHLVVVGGELVRCTEARRFLREVLNQPYTDDDLRPVARALYIIEDQLEQLGAAINGLSTIEYDLLRGRTQQEYFQDGCIAAFLNWSLEWETRPSGLGVLGSQAVHGVWGTLPWWNITVRDAGEVEAAEAVLKEGMLPLGFECDPADSSRLVLICRKPKTKSMGMRARFVFDLKSLAHACELLLIGRRHNISVDVLREVEDEWEGVESIHMGTLNITADRELIGLITKIAMEALKEALPNDQEAVYDHHWGNQSASEVLQHISGYNLDSYLSARHLLVVQPHESRGEIALEATDPPMSMASFSRHQSKCGPGERSSHTGKSLAARSLSSFSESGFVYVQRNPAFPEMLKVGYSKRLPEDRAQELSGTAVPFPFDVLYRSAMSCAHEVERAVHRLLAAHRVSPNREYFRVSLETAVEAIRHCQGELTGINAWESMPAVHRLHAGDRVTLPLKADQIFVLTAYRHPLSDSSAEALDIWQAHADGDVLEIYVTNDPGHVSGLSDGDPDGDKDPVPFLNRDNSAPNGMLIGRERLMAGDRLIWLCDEEGTAHCRSVVFEANEFCQVACRTWNPQMNPIGLPILLKDLIRKLSRGMVSAVREVLALGVPHTWAPRSPDAEGGWAEPATDPQPPEYWLRQLRQRSKDR